MLLIVSDGKKCSFSFREDTHCWHLLISEMWSGSVLSEEQNDQLVRERAVHNVLVVDAFLRRFDIRLIILIGKSENFVHTHLTAN